MKKHLLLIALGFLLHANLFAASGCLRSGQVYTNPPSGWYQWTNAIQDNCPSGASTSTQYANINSVTGTSCSIGFLGFSGTGVIVNYNIEFCPIDDYVPLIIVLIGGAASYFLRKKSLYGIVS